MHRWLGTTVATALLLTACVTINVYFPAAEAKEAAKEFVEKVIGDEVPAAHPAPEPSRPGGGSASLMPQRDVGFDWLALVGISSAYAQERADINIKTPAIQAIQSRMAERFRGQLQVGFDAGALGLTRDGMIEVRDAAKLALKDRVAITQAVADDNRDRRAVYKEIAVANGHPEWEDQIRSTFAQQWIASARSGWWYQDAGGGWKQK
ncbi:YdbL family protein [Pseudoxanthomonas sp. UTMC 1351]|uniref:YdbL family protein n=1 Tax=Pseudoxanthomonas sp. UTMC 1351 TaxID=2695853 RepID=UPI0034CE4709